MNEVVKQVVDAIEQNYTDPKIYADSMSKYLANKAKVLLNNFQECADVLTMTDENGRNYDIIGMLAEFQDNGDIVATGDQIAGEGVYESIIQEYNAEQIAEHDLVPVPSEIKTRILPVLQGTTVSDETIVPNSELLASLTYERDQIFPEKLEIMGANGVKVPTSKVTNFVHESVGTIKQMSNAFGVLAKERDNEAGLASDFTNALTDGLSTLQGTLAGPATAVLGSVLTTGGSIFDKVKGITSIIAQGAEDALASSSDSSGEYPGHINVNDYDMCNVTAAMGQTDGAKPFKQAARAVKTTVVVVGSLVGKLCKLGATLVKKAWNKYVDPLVSNRIITQDEEAATYEFDVPSIHIEDTLDNLLTNTVEIPNVYVNEGGSSNNLPGTGSLATVLTSWFGMTLSEITVLVEDLLKEDQMLHMQTDFGSLYIRTEVTNNITKLLLDVFVAPTTPPEDTLYSWGTGYSNSYWVFPMMTISLKEHYLNSSLAYVDCESSRNSDVLPYTRLIDYIAMMFGLDTNAPFSVKNKFNNSDFDIKDPSKLIAGATASLVRWSIYMALRNYYQSQVFSFDGLLTATWATLCGQDTMDHPEAFWMSDLASLPLRTLRITGMLGIPLCISSTWKNSSTSYWSTVYDFALFGKVFRVGSSVSQSDPNIFSVRPTESAVVTQANNWKSYRQSTLSAGSSADGFFDAGGIILCPFTIGTDPDNLPTNSFFVHACLYPFALPTQRADIARFRQSSGAVSALMLETFLGGILSNQLEVMKSVYAHSGFIPNFIPYEKTTKMPSQRYHIVSTSEMKYKAQHITDIIVTGVTMLAIAAAAVVISVKLKKYGKVRLTNLAMRTEATRYKAEDVYKAAQSKSPYAFGNVRIPCDHDMEILPSSGVPSDIEHEITKCFNKSKNFDFSDYASTFPQEFIPSNDDAVRYQNDAAKTAKRSVLLAKVTSKLTGAKEDYSGYIDNSTPDEAESNPTNLSPVETKIKDLSALITG